MSTDPQPMDATTNESAFKKGKGVFQRRKKKKIADDGKADEVTTNYGAAHLRMQRDITELELPDNVKLVQKDGDLMNFSLVIEPNMGYWNGGMYEFKFNIPAKYPFEGPKVVCVDKIYHPNIDLEGKICVNVLRPWKPTYSIQIILFGLLFLYSNPNPEDPLNNEAAEDMRTDKKRFTQNVLNSMRGLSVNGERFTRNRGKGVPR